MKADPITAVPPAPASSVRRFFQRPKGVLILLLAALTAAAAVDAGLMLVAPGVLAALVTAIVIDAPLLHLRTRRWSFPDGAVLTGLIVAMILSSHEPWWIAAVTTAIGVLSKYVFRTKATNVFNPAAFALLVNYLIFGSGQSWWGALSEAAPVAIGVLMITGLYIADRVTRLPAAVSFLGGYYLLFTIAAFFSDPVHVSGIYRPPDLQAALFFALFMVTDPPTSPPRARDQVLFGLAVAALSFAIFQLAPGIYYLLVALLLANLGEAWRRIRSRAAHRHGAPAV